MMDSASGQIKAGYQYGAFGEQLAAVGSMKDAFHFGWSTKFTVDGMRLINFGKRWYDTRHGRFVNRDPIGERGGINLYAFLANNPLGGYELLGMGFLDDLLQSSIDLKRGRADKAHKRLHGAVDSFLGDYADTFRMIALGFVPVVGPFLAAAYGAYIGYQAGGVLGAVAGALGGYAGAKALLGSVNVVRSIVSRLAVGEAVSMAVRAVDRRIRGFAKWFGRGMNAVTVANGFSNFNRAFARSEGEVEASISGSTQLSANTPKYAAAGIGTVAFGELEFDLDVRTNLQKSWDFDRAMESVLDAAKSAARAAQRAVFAQAREARLAAIYQYDAEVHRLNAQPIGPQYTNRDSARAYLSGGMGTKAGDALLIVGGSAAAPVVIYGAATYSPLVVAYVSKSTYAARASYESFKISNAYKKIARGAKKSAVAYTYWDTAKGAWTGIRTGEFPSIESGTGSLESFVTGTMLPQTPFGAYAQFMGAVHHHAIYSEE